MRKTNSESLILTPTQLAKAPSSNSFDFIRWLGEQTRPSKDLQSAVHEIRDLDSVLLDVLWEYIYVIDLARLFTIYQQKSEALYYQGVAAGLKRAIAALGLDQDRIHLERLYSTAIDSAQDPT